uniref:ADF-H domain-containing protein n=1 Tax=Hymenolepis diminuta TaxID=6216 RepID=A0A0R3SLB2_HYMDI
LIYHVEAIRDISSAYRDARYEGKKALMSVMNGNAIELIFEERPLMVLKLKSAKSILGLKSKSINKALYSTLSGEHFKANDFTLDNTGKTEFDIRWLGAPIVSSTLKRGLCCFLLLPLGLLITT